MRRKARQWLQVMQGVNPSVDPYTMTVAQANFNLYTSMTAEGTEDTPSFEDVLLAELREQYDEREDTNA